MVFNSINTFHSGTPIVFNNFHSSTGKEEWILMDVFIGTTLHGSQPLLLSSPFLDTGGEKLKRKLENKRFYLFSFFAGTDTSIFKLTRKAGGFPRNQLVDLSCEENAARRKWGGSYT